MAGMHSLDEPFAVSRDSSAPAEVDGPGIDRDALLALTPLGREILQQLEPAAFDAPD